MMNREIPKKNYIILGIVIIVTFLLMYYFYMWYHVYMDNELSSSVMDKYMEVINYNELDNYLVENNNAIVYISVLEDEEIRDFEKQLKVLLRKRVIDKDILYMDITNDKKNLSTIISKYTSGEFNYDVPIILVIEDGNIRDFYNIKENNYDIESVKLFIDGIKFLEEDELSG